MNQKLSDLASLAEIVSGVAVVVTLVFLVIGIRDNADVTRFSVYSDLLNEINENERARINNPELAPA